MQVYVPPTFTLWPSNASVPLDADVWMHCAAEGNPQPHVDWYFNSRQRSQWFGPSAMFK
jgi:hypothetical protein